METPPSLGEFSAIDPLYRADLKQIIEAMPAARLLGVLVAGFDRSGLSRIELPVRPEHTFDGRSVQAGIVGALADFAGVSASAAALGEGWMASTTGFELHNLAPANGRRLIAVGRPLTSSRTHGVATVTVFSVGSQDETVAVAHATTICRPFSLKPGE
jgi:uncharacterized protein (TIGR00369 family)